MYLILEVFTVVKMWIVVFYVMAWCNIVGGMQFTTESEVEGHFPFLYIDVFR
jgi:hypothetical protein